MSRRDRIAKNRDADRAWGAVDACRRWARDGLGFNCTFVDDDAKVLVGLAQRAVLAGLATDFDADMQRRFAEAAEKHRGGHEESLGFALLAQRIEHEPSKLGVEGSNPSERTTTEGQSSTE